MHSMTDEALALEAHLGAELHRRSAELTRLWLDRLAERLDVAPRRIFPSSTLLNHMPEVLRAISQYLCSGGDLAAEMHVREELDKLARLRREQGYDIDEILAELEILGQILYDALREEARGFDRMVPADYAIAVADYRTSVSASFAERLAPQATRVTLREGQPATVSLVVRNPE